jgi:hypothetical protein
MQYAINGAVEIF